MLKGLCAGFGEPLGDELCAALAGRGVQLVRQELPSSLLHERFDVLRDELDRAGLRALWILHVPAQAAWLRQGEWAEYGNEPDLNDKDVSAYLDGYRAAIAFAREQGVRLSPGAVSNLNKRGFDYLRAMISTVPADAPVAVHRYPQWPGPDAAHADVLPAWQQAAQYLRPTYSRADEVKRLRDIIGDRALWLTEFGYHTATEHGHAWTDAQAARFVEWEWTFWETQGAECAVLYQLNDGSTETAIDRFGIRRHDGSWKPVMDTFGLEQESLT